ncbi:hypothetical protein [Pseudomonas capeferrum]
MEYPSFENKPKKRAILVAVCLVFGAWILYMLWAVRIGTRTVLMPSVPEWTTYTLVGCLIGLIFAGRAIYYRPAGRSLKRVADSFVGGFCLGLGLSLNIYNVCTYLLPGELVHYESAYELNIPGRSFGRAGRCEAGLGFKDLKTERWIELCTTKSELDDRRKKGMNAVWVTAHSNKIGSYILGYEFIYK